MKEDRFSGIKEFLATVETGSFTAAADTLGLTGSAVGKSISRLEARLKTQLFHRSTRRLMLTGEGELWLAGCRRIMDELTQAETLLCGENQSVTGSVRIDLPTSYGRKIVLPKLLALGRQHPDLRFAVSFQDRKSDLIGEQIDIAVRFAALDDLADVVARQISRYRWQVYATPAFLERHGTPAHPDDLRRTPCLSGSLNTAGTQVWRLLGTNGAPADIPIAVRHQLGDGDAVIQALLADAGIAMLPDWLMEEYVEKQQVVTILNDFLLPPAPIYALWQKKARQPPKVQAVLTCLGAVS